MVACWILRPTFWIGFWTLLNYDQLPIPTQNMFQQAGPSEPALPAMWCPERLTDSVGAVKRSENQGKKLRSKKEKIKPPNGTAKTTQPKVPLVPPLNVTAGELGTRLHKMECGRQQKSNASLRVSFSEWAFPGQLYLRWLLERPSACLPAYFRFLQPQVSPAVFFRERERGNLRLTVRVVLSL